MYSGEMLQETATNVFSRGNLELTFSLLRPHSPTLALAIQNNLTEAFCPKAPCDPDETITLDLDEDAVAGIVDKLADIGQQMSTDSHYNKQDLIAIRCLLMDWLIYAQSFIEDEADITTPSAGQ